MYSEARKIHLIEELLKVKNEAVLIEIELILKEAARSIQNVKLSAHQFLRLWNKEDAEAIENAIWEAYSISKSIPITVLRK